MRRALTNGKHSLMGEPLGYPPSGVRGEAVPPSVDITPVSGQGLWIFSAIIFKHAGDEFLGFLDPRDTITGVHHSLGAGVVGRQSQGQGLVEHIQEIAEVAATGQHIFPDAIRISHPQIRRGSRH